MSKVRLDQMVAVAGDAITADYVATRGKDGDSSSLSDTDIALANRDAEETALQQAADQWCKGTPECAQRLRNLINYQDTYQLSEADRMTQVRLFDLTDSVLARNASLQRSLKAAQDKSDALAQDILLMQSPDMFSAFAAKLDANPRLLALIPFASLKSLAEKAKRFHGEGDPYAASRLAAHLLAAVSRTATMKSATQAEKNEAIDAYAQALLFLPQAVVAERCVEQPGALRALPLSRRSNVLDYVFFVQDAQMAAFRAFAGAFKDLWLPRDLEIIARREALWRDAS